MTVGVDAGALRRAAAEAQDRVIRLRREIHADPEVGLDLPRTQRKVLSALSDLELDVRLGRGASYVAAVLRGARPGPCVLLRADMDALAVQEPPGLEFASPTPGMMHACGHDAHAAMLAGAARVLAGRAAELAGSVLFFFEAGEEGGHGARIAIEEGLLAGPSRPAAAFALHVAPSLPAGTVATRPGALMAASTTLRFVIHGRGAHAAFPHRSADPIPAACDITRALSALPRAECSPSSPAVLTVTGLRTSTNLTNVIPDDVSCVATLRTTAPGDAERLAARARHIAEGLSAALGLTCDMEIVPMYPLTSNDEACADMMLEAAGRVAPEVATLALPWATSEDFGSILEQVPGAMALLGVAPAGDERGELHSPRLRIDEDALATGVATYAAVALEALRR